MSSSSRRRPDRRTAAALLAVLAALWLAPAPAAAAVPLPVVAVLPGAERTSLVVDVGAGTAPVATRTAAIAVDGEPQQAELVPVISDRLSVALVVDASDAGATALPAWLSAAARFILEVPSGVRAAAIADTSPPAVLTPLRRGPTEVVRALSGARADGIRRTSAALTLAVEQFGPQETGPRVVVLYTTAADAGGETAAALAARFVRAGTMLVVVGTAGGSTYWPEAARATGGFFAPAGTPVVVPALDQVETTLRGRYLVRFETPGTLPARVSVRIDAGGLSLTGGAVVPAEAGGPGSSGRSSGIDIGVGGWWLAAAGLTVLAVAVLGAVFYRARRRRRLRTGPLVAEAGVARGRAPVPDARAPGVAPRWVVRGSSPVPPARTERESEREDNQPV